jgi:hypothetical protein
VEIKVDAVPQSAVASLDDPAALARQNFVLQSHVFSSFLNVCAQDSTFNI